MRTGRCALEAKGRVHRRTFSITSALRKAKEMKETVKAEGKEKGGGQVR